ncbi:MarR family winged helix-turn-helix transcriptional regulator [Chitinophaga japonensis]|uniref:DNA-binding MarR family transcriptional regulator n=1 Tax=Chitinophaga japonensis TaxID=104662 RepID=A0A562SSF5_CHIJA|nr:MarR family transcriptional regulator [Chitinophaga japonensis]TWI83954.1 DNA-binding MarR family transcriptional regulator [Chitinophaga japonensis]
MKIEEAIKQARFGNNFQKAVVNLIYTSNWLRDTQADIFKKYDILPQHFNALRIIKGRCPKPVSAGEIKDVLLDKASDVTRLLDKLVKQGYVKRQLCEYNRRKMDITITTKGLQLLEELEAPIASFYEDLATRLSQEEALLLSDLLDRVRR